MILIVMGVSGCGKSTIGSLLAQKLQMKFYDADNFHSEQNIDKMKNGIPLDDEDRSLWLTDLATNISQWNMYGGAVLACSALREKHRGILSHGGKEDVMFIHLDGDISIIRDRITERSHHFFPVSLLENQFKILEPPRKAITVSIDNTTDNICAEVINKLANGGFFNLGVE